MGNLVPIGQSKPPSRLLLRKGQSTSLSNFTEGVTDSFPRLSIRGKAFWAKIGGKEVRVGAINEKGAIVDLVLINASRNLTKSYYAKPFATGDGEMPDCWSLDSIRPDASIVNKVNPTCGDCPKNAFNSAPSGRGGKACQDAKRLVVTTADQLGKADPLLLIMKLPQQSLKNMKGYVELLARNDYVEPYACVTRMSFDQDTEYPKVQFEFVEPLTDEEFDAADELAKSKKVNDMLKNPDFDNAASDINAKHANDDDTDLKPQRRLAQQGLAAEPEPEETRPTAKQPDQKVSRETPKPEPEPEEKWDDMGDGTELNLATGEVRDIAVKEPEVLETDPDVVATSDGRFFHRVQRKFVDSPYKGAAPAPVTAKAAAPEPEQPVKKTRKPRTAKVEEPVAEEPAAEEAAPVAAKTNGAAAAAPRPKVVAATPQLDQLLGSLVPPHEDE